MYNIKLNDMIIWNIYTWRQTDGQTDRHRIIVSLMEILSTTLKWIFYYLISKIIIRFNILLYSLKLSLRGISIWGSFPHFWCVFDVLSVCALEVLLRLAFKILFLEIVTKHLNKLFYFCASTFSNDFALRNDFFSYWNSFLEETTIV